VPAGRVVRRRPGLRALRERLDELDHLERYKWRLNLSVRDLADHKVFTLQDVKKLKDPEDLYKLGMRYLWLLEYVKRCSEDESKGQAASAHAGEDQNAEVEDKKLKVLTHEGTGQLRPRPTPARLSRSEKRRACLYRF